jgi:hypothetical protein
LARVKFDLVALLFVWHADLRSNAARHAAGISSGGSPINNSELLRRLRETQALLVKFSEENGRLARDNEKLQVRHVSVNMLTASMGLFTAAESCWLCSCNMQSVYL